jgi:acyl carrier protein
LAEITREIREYIVSNFLFGNNGDLLKDQDSFFENGLIDSTGILELITYVQDHFGISPEDREIIPDNLDSVEKIAAFVERKRKVEG